MSGFILTKADFSRFSKITFLILIGVIYIDPIRDFMNKNYNLEITKEEYSGTKIFGAFTNLKKFMNIFYLFMIIFCSWQVFIGPLVNNVPLAGTILGSIVNVWPWESLTSIKFFLLWGILPLFLYKNMKRLTSRGRSQDQDSKLKKFLN